MNLEKAIDNAIAELLRTTPHTGRPVYAPSLRELGEDLKEAKSKYAGKEFRLDVLDFAMKMSDVMDVKDQEKGPVTDGYTAIQALGDMQGQFRKLEEHNFMADKEQVRRVLIHIANFAMIAERKL